MTLEAGSVDFWCARCGEPYEARHPVHPEDRGQTPPLARLAELPRRRDLLAGLYGWPCPTCSAGPGMWCIGEGGASLLDMHEARR